MGAGTPRRSRPPTRSPGLEIQLCMAGVPKQGARSRSLSLHVKRGDLPGWRLLGALPEQGPLPRVSGHRLAHPSLVPALQTSGTQPELPCLQTPRVCSVSFTFLNCWGLSAAPGFCQHPWPGDSGLTHTIKRSPDPRVLHRVSSLPSPTLEGPETTTPPVQGLNCVPKSVGWSPAGQHPRMGPYLEIGSL